ncbi:MAG: hypothetical protein M1840_006470 [Geoglossum simile]|nr:MAG: hypothetical protein M1840_006470 [Geoglossum simile]
MDRLTQNPPSFSASFPSSWTVGVNRRSSPLPLPPLPHQRSPSLAITSPSLAITSPSPAVTSPSSTAIASCLPAPTSEYLTHFPSSWVVSSTRLPQSPEYKPEYLANTARDTVGLASSTFYPELTLRPRISDVPKHSGPGPWLSQGEGLKQRLLAHISPSRIEQTLAPRRGQKATGSTVPAPIPTRQEKQLSQLPEEVHNQHNHGSDSKGSLEYKGDDSDSDGSGLGDAPHQPLEFADTYSVYTISSAGESLR